MCSIVLDAKLTVSGGSFCEPPDINISKFCYSLAFYVDFGTISMVTYLDTDDIIKRHRKGTDMSNLTLALQTANVDTEGAIRRFSGNADIYELFLKKFPLDDSFGQLTSALNAQDWEALQVATHTLKGVSGNLGMTRLFYACTQLSTFVREGNILETQKIYIELETAYHEVCSVIDECGEVCT